MGIKFVWPTKIFKVYMEVWGGVFLKVKPLGPKSDQHQFSNDNMSGSSRIKVMRITK